MYTVMARILNKESNEALTPDGVIFKLYDKDLIDDDFLGETKMGADGRVEIQFKTSDFRTIDSPFEKLPDLYFTLYKFGKLIYKSQVVKDVEIEDFSHLESGKGKVIDLGTFVV